MNITSKEIDQLINNWRLVLPIGVLYMGIGFIILFAPIASYVTLTIIFSILILINGIFEIAFAFYNKKQFPGWSWHLIDGILNIILGSYFIYDPLLSMEIIPFIIAAWFMIRGLSSTRHAMILKRHRSHEWSWYIIFSAFAILCSILILCYPTIGMIYAIYMLSLTFFSLGFSRIMLYFEIKRLHDRF